MDNKFICQRCERETNELNEVEIHYPSLTCTDLICNHCLDDLVYEVLEYVFLRKVT